MSGEVITFAPTGANMPGSTMWADQQYEDATTFWRKYAAEMGMSWEDFQVRGAMYGYVPGVRGYQGADATAFLDQSGIYTNPNTGSWAGNNAPSSSSWYSPSQIDRRATNYLHGTRTEALQDSAPVNSPAPGAAPAPAPAPAPSAVIPNPVALLAGINPKILIALAVGVVLLARRA